MVTLSEEPFELPESYAVNRVSLAVRDPECLFVSWDVDARSLETLRAQVGERVVAASPLTLRVGETGAEGPPVYPPSGARSRYVACVPERSYRAELGLTLPWGEFRRLAHSNRVDTPGVGPSPEPARRVLRYPDGSDVTDAAKANGFPRRPGWQERPGLRSHAGRGQRPGASESFGPGGASDLVHK
jgi:hypothetical protein